MPASTTVRPELAEPLLGREYRNPFVFKWNGSLSAGQAYVVTVYHPGSEYTIQSEALTAQQWTVDLPAERYGEWRWWVSVIGSGGVVDGSSEWMFWFNPFPGADATPTCQCYLPTPP